MPSLALRQVRVDLGGRPLLADVELEVHPGELVALTGPSGAGKTSLLRVIAALADPAGGALSLGGRGPDALGWPAWRRRVTYVAQEPYLADASVRDVLARPFAYATADRSFEEVEARVGGWLERLGLGGADRLAQGARTLSVGERQRVALVRALAIDPEVLLLDEPTSALDRAATGAVEALVTGWIAAGDRAALVVTHDEEQAARWCHRRVELAPFVAPDRGRRVPESVAGGALPLSAWHLVIAASLVVVAGLVSLVLRLGLERRLAVASVRTVVQLLLIGYLLEWVFGVERVELVLAMVALMVLAAGRAAVGRSSRTFRGSQVGAFASLALTGTLTTLVVTHLVIGVEPWWKPQYLLPLLGMVLGNSLTGISLCLDALLDSLSSDRARIETELALGASRWEAVRGPLSDAVRRGMIPIINAMMVVGIVSLPGMMTGQILAGADPLPAVKYQIVVMFMIAGASATGCISIALFCYRRLFNAHHQLQADRIHPRR